MTNEAVAASGSLVEQFAAPAGRYLGYVAVAFSAALLVVIAVEDAGIRAIYAVSAVGLLSWVTLIRPAVSLHANGVLLQNMLRDSFVPSSKIVRCVVAPMLQVQTEDRRFVCVGVNRSAVSRLRERSGGRRGGFLPGAKLPEPEQPKYAEVAKGGNYSDYVVTRILRAAADAGTDDREPVVAFAWPAVAALLVAVVLVVLAVV